MHMRIQVRQQSSGAGLGGRAAMRWMPTERQLEEHGLQGTHSQKKKMCFVLCHFLCQLKDNSGSMDCKVRTLKTNILCKAHSHKKQFFFLKGSSMSKDCKVHTLKKKILFKAHSHREKNFLSVDSEFDFLLFREWLHGCTTFCVR